MLGIWDLPVFLLCQVWPRSAWSNLAALIKNYSRQQGTEQKENGPSPLPLRTIPRRCTTHMWPPFSSSLETVLCLVAQSLRPHRLQPTRLLCPWGFSSQEYWSGLPCPPPGDLTDPGIKPRSPTLQADFLLSKPPGKPRILEWVAYSFSRGSP